MDLRHKMMASPLYDWFGKRSFAQSGEDIIAWGELKELKNSRNLPCRQAGQKRKAKIGFYVDIGAYHPKLFSNTYFFYKKGWKGICVEPNPEMETLFRLVRPRDVFLNLGVGGKKTQKFKNSKSQSMEYFVFEDGAANTFSAKQARKNQEEAGRTLKEVRRIKVKPLRQILKENLPKGQKIDLMSIDVEGMDEEVLRSNDWKKYRPEMIIAEDLDFDLNDISKTQNVDHNIGGVVGFLKSVGYKLVAKTPYSLIFKVN